MSHATHHDDCGGQYAALNALMVKQRADFAKQVDAFEARIATLEAELAEVRDSAMKNAELFVEMADEKDALANALRDALEKIRNTAWIVGNEGLRAMCQEALAQTPAASLAALKAEVLELAAAKCAEIARGHSPENARVGTGRRHETKMLAAGAKMCAAAIRALAAQEVTK